MILFKAFRYGYVQPTMDTTIWHNPHMTFLKAMCNVGLRGYKYFPSAHTEKYHSHTDKQQFPSNNTIQTRHLNLPSAWSNQLYNPHETMSQKYMSHPPWALVLVLAWSSSVIIIFLYRHWESLNWVDTMISHQHTLKNFTHTQINISLVIAPF